VKIARHRLVKNHEGGAAPQIYPTGGPSSDLSESIRDVESERVTSGLGPSTASQVGTRGRFGVRSGSRSLMKCRSRHPPKTGRAMTVASAAFPVSAGLRSPLAGGQEFPQRVGERRGRFSSGEHRQSPSASAKLTESAESVCLTRPPCMARMPSLRWLPLRLVVDAVSTAPVRWARV
jgi:hypothetical protein